MNTGKKKQIFALAFIFLIAFGLRLAGVGNFMTVDEEKWMLRSGDFYHNFFDQKDPGGTFTTTHPGATVQWLAGAGIYWQEMRLGAGIDTSNLRLFRLVSTVPVALFISCLIIMTVLLLGINFNPSIAFWGGLLLATEPYVVGSSQIVHVDMLLALFMLDAVLCLFLFIRAYSAKWLVASGVCFGLSLATKALPALWFGLFALVFLKLTFLAPLTFRQVFQPGNWRNLFIKLTRTWLLVIGVAVLTFWAAWPALWIKSGLGAYYQRDIVSVVVQERVNLDEGAEQINPAGFYIRTLLGRTSPFVLLLATGMLWIVVRTYFSLLVSRHFISVLPRHGASDEPDEYVSLPKISWLIVYAIGYLIMVSLAAKKADRYALPALVVLPVLAGASITVAWSVFKSRLIKLYQPIWGFVAKSLLIAALFMQSFLLTPYAIAYNNPFLPHIRPLSQQGWGEGLDLAAKWLNSHPLADRLVVASWYPAVLRTYFVGETMSLSSRHDDRVGYVLLYRNMFGRSLADPVNDILEEYQNKSPVKVIYIGGQPQVWIYEQLGLHYFPQHVGEITSQFEVGQTVIAPKFWSGVEIGFSTFSGRQNTTDIILEIKRDPADQTAIRQAKINASQLQDSAWHQINFDPITSADNQQYYISLTSPNGVMGNAVTVRYVERDIYPGSMLLRRRQLQANENPAGFFRPEWDLALRLLTI